MKDKIGRTSLKHKIIQVGARGVRGSSPFHERQFTGGKKATSKMVFHTLQPLIHD